MTAGSRIRPTLLHRAEYALFAGAAAAGRAMGASGAAALGRCLGDLAWLLGVRRRVVEDQLRLAFPDRDRNWIRATARACYRHWGRELFSMVRLGATSMETVRAITEVVGFEALEDAWRAGRGLVVVTGHVGNWEIGGAALAARGLPLHVVAQRQSNPLFDRAVVRAREGLGMSVIERKDAPRLALRHLRAGQAVAFVADQDARRAGEFVPFFGRLASTHRGPALMALRTGAPLFVGSTRRTANGYRITLEPVALPAERTADPDAVRTLTAAFTAKLEAAIRAAPEQYFWYHRRWKTRPREEPPASVPGI